MPRFCSASPNTCLQRREGHANQLQIELPHCCQLLLVGHAGAVNDLLCLAQHLGVLLVHCVGVELDQQSPQMVVDAA